MSLVRTKPRKSLRRGVDRRVERELHARGYAKPGDDRALRNEIRAMFDSGPLGAANPRRTQFKFFPGTQASSGVGGWQSWTIPRNATWVYLLCVGSGGSGAGGQTSGAGVLGGGGGGGGSGAMARLLIPAMFLPKTLYLFPGAGGAGVAAANAGSVGVISWVSDKPSNAAVGDIVLRSGSAAATAAANPAGASSAGGTGEVIAANTNQVFSCLGLWTAMGGQTGTNGGASAGAGVNVTWGAVGIFNSSGAGGGTTNTTTGAGAGGNITGAGLVASIVGGAAATAGPNGTNYGFFPGGSLGPSATAGQIFASTGGTGGGAGASTTGGAGGNGGYASGGGGGGGGGGTSGGTGGRGGAGGPGFIVVSWW